MTVQILTTQHLLFPSAKHHLLHCRLISLLCIGTDSSVTRGKCTALETASSGTSWHRVSQNKAAEKTADLIQGLKSLERYIKSFPKKLTWCRKSLWHKEYNCIKIMVITQGELNQKKRMLIGTVNYTQLFNKITLSLRHRPAHLMKLNLE